MAREGNIEGGLLRAQNMPHPCLAGNATVWPKNDFRIRRGLRRPVAPLTLAKGGRFGVPQKLVSASNVTQAINSC
jgi:hypothetical protein